MNYKDEWNKIGYNREELYFEKVNRELIHKMRAQRAAQNSNTQQTMGQVLQFRSKSAVDYQRDQKKKAA